jgi:DNA-binding XRE family transcriptional regulator
MNIKDALPKLRKERGLTQADLAAKVYVTRQAVSRWETGETSPGVDMRKLLAAALAVPVTDLLDLPEDPVCQCCGTPFSVPHMECGTDADGSENPAFCKWCYDEGAFAYQSMDDVIEYCAPFMAQGAGVSVDEAVSYLGAMLPTLEHWKKG